MSERKPTGYKCLNCGKLHYPQHGRCLQCKHREFEEVPVPSKGKLITYTKLKAPPSGIASRSLFLGIIDLGDVRYTGQIDVEDLDDLRIGMDLVATWKQVRTIDNRAVYGFVWGLP
ncbi:MAG: Zn-ribbon domain-containing OB-fold protein [Candidatus Hodarchaeales archaeon]|jgi:uncharacterized OB-fold protein